MSCPAENKPLHVRLAEANGEPIELPMSYYFLTVAMILFVAGVPFLYRQIWLLFVDLIEEIRVARSGPTPIKGCRKLGSPASRNLSTEFANKASNSRAAATEEERWKVVALFNYPIKSCFGIELDEAEVMEYGFKYDRQFSFAQFHMPTKRKSDVPVWEFMTIRGNPALTRIKTELWIPDESLLGYDPKQKFIKSGGCLIGSFTFMPEISLSLQGLRNWWSILVARLATRNWSAVPTFYFHIPCNPTVDQMKESKYGDEHMVIWKDYPDAVDMGSEIPSHVMANLKAFLNVTNQLTLFRVNSRKSRKLFKNAPTKEQLGYQANVGFQDSYPLSIQNMASIMDMESRVPTAGGFKPDARRYRGNIYISGPPIYDEDYWTLIRIGSKNFHVSCRTTRCNLPNTDPDTGKRDNNEPQKTMRDYRCIDPGNKMAACLGMQMVPSKDAVGETIKVGDEVKLLKTGEHFFIAAIEPEHQRPIL